MTSCAHMFCQACLTEWMKRRPEGKCCPMCRSPISTGTLHQIVVSHSIEATSEETTMISKHVSNVHVPYLQVEGSIMSSISATLAVGDYGSKIQTLMKHILFILESDPKAKLIVFSAWLDSLHIISHALTSNGVQHLRIDTSGSRLNPVHHFNNDDSVSVLLLHGERDNAGLNITAAKYVFLLEPVINHAFEVQAIARVDRLGQDKETSVFCYYVENTIEKNILDHAYQHGRSLYVEGVMSLNGDITSKEHKLGSIVLDKGDSVASVEDMLTLLFPGSAV